MAETTDYTDYTDKYADKNLVKHLLISDIRVISGNILIFLSVPDFQGAIYQYKISRKWNSIIQRDKFCL